MKAIKLLVLGMVLAFAGAAQGQISVNVHIGTPPAWGPYGYEGVRYYYLPDVEAYYDVQTSMFIYLSGQNWIHRSYLPSRYRNYDLYHGYKVVMKDYHGNTPYYNHNAYKSRYGKGYRGAQQRTIGNRNSNVRNQRSAVNTRNNNNRNQRIVVNTRNNNNRNAGNNRNNRNAGNNKKNK